MWPFKEKVVVQEEKPKAHRIIWDDTITAKEVMDLFMFHVSPNGAPACWCKSSTIPAHLKKFFQGAE